MIVGILANPWWCCRVLSASWQGVRPNSCRSLWPLYPFLLTCWMQEEWWSLTSPHKHAARMFDAPSSHVSCSMHSSGYLSMTVHMGWTPSYQKMHSAVAVPRSHMLSHLIVLSLLCWLWQMISVLLWVVGGQVPHTHHGIPLTSDLLWDRKSHCGVWSGTLLLDNSEYGLW